MEPIKKMCMKSHLNEVTLDKVMQVAGRNQFQMPCSEPGCKYPVALSRDNVARLLELSEEDAKDAAIVVDAFKKWKQNEETRVTEPKDSGEEKMIVQEEETVISNTDKDHTTEDDQIYSTNPDLQAVPERRAEPERVRSPVRVPIRNREREPQPALESRRSSGILLDEETAEITPRDLLVAVIEDSGLPPTETGQLCEWVGLSVGADWDPDAVRDLCVKFGLTAAITTKIVNRFRNQVELHNLRRKRNDALLDVAGRVRTGPQASYQGPHGGYGNSSAGPFAGIVPPAPANDPCAQAVQAVIAAAGGVITPQVLQQIDVVRAAFGQMMTGVPGGSPGASINLQAFQAQTIQMVKEVLESTQQKKQIDEERVKERAETDKKFAELQNLIMVTAVGNKNSVPINPPQDTRVLDALLSIVKEKPVPVVAGKTREDTMFEQMFQMFIEIAKGKPDAAMAPFHQELVDLKDQVGRIGGGFAGLPTNPDQLHGIIDYTRAMADIRRTDNEFADKKANRDLIQTIAQSAFSSIGEAVATTFVQNAGTPQEKSVTLKEQPIDDGSAVSVECPQCHVLMIAPKDAATIRCPQCNAIFDRIPQERTPDQAMEIQKRLQQEVEAAAAAASKQEISPVPEEKQVPTQEVPGGTQEVAPPTQEVVPLSVVKERQVPADIGPMSRAILSGQTIKQSPVDKLPGSAETDLSRPDEHSSEEPQSR